jgi:hypothetical protein
MNKKKLPLEDYMHQRKNEQIKDMGHYTTVTITQNGIEYTYIMNIKKPS